MLDDRAEEIVELRAEVAEWKLKASTTLSGDQLIRVLLQLPIVVSFTLLSIIIIWQTTKNPAEVAPHLDIMLVAMGLLSGPTIVIVNATIPSGAKGGRDDE